MASTSTLQRASTNGTPIASATDTSVIAAPGAGAYLRIMRIRATNSSATACRTSWREAVGGTKHYPANLGQNGTDTIDLGVRPWNVAANTAFYLNTSAAGSIEYTVDYFICPTI